MVYTCNAAPLVAEVWNGGGFIEIRFKSPWVDGCIVWLPVIQRKEKNQSKY